MRISDWSSDVCSADLLQASTETHWPRHETMSFHHSPRRLVHDAYDAEQGGLASAITSYQTHIQFRWKVKFMAFKNHLPGPVPGAESFVTFSTANIRFPFHEPRSKERRVGKEWVVRLEIGW